jgi:hypothetical protein
VDADDVDADADFDVGDDVTDRSRLLSNRTCLNI